MSVKEDQTAVGVFAVGSARSVRSAAGPPAALSRRSFARRFIRRQVLFRHVRQEIFSVDPTVDISEGGLFIATMRPLVVGSHITGSLRPDRSSSTPPIRFDAEVVWRSPRLDDSAKGPGIAVCFTHLSAASRQRLDALLHPATTR